MNYSFLNSLKFLSTSLVVLVCLSACDRSANASPLHSSGIYVSDTMLYKDHSYIIVREHFNTYFSVLHSPDCQCRFNRRFIVVKHEK